MVNLAQYLTLERPLAVVDLETTGFDSKMDRICQISITIHYTHRDPIHWESLINPERPITNHKESHGITDEAVQGKPTFAQVAPALAPKIMNVDICGYNVDFDIGFLRAEMARAGVSWPWKGHTIDSYVIYKKKKPHNLTNAYLEYGGEDGNPLPPGSRLDGAHNAEIDVAATEVVMRGQILRHSDLPKTIPELSAWCFPQKSNPNRIDENAKFVWNEQGEPCIAFGKYARNGPCPMRQVGRDYWKFIADNDFPADVKQIAALALTGVYPVKGLL